MLHVRARRGSGAGADPASDGASIAHPRTDRREHPREEAAREDLVVDATGVLGVVLRWRFGGGVGEGAVFASRRRGPGRRRDRRLLGRVGRWLGCGGRRWGGGCGGRDACGGHRGRCGLRRGRRRHHPRGQCRDGGGRRGCRRGGGRRRREEREDLAEQGRGGAGFDVGHRTGDRSQGGRDPTPESGRCNGGRCRFGRGGCRGTRSRCCARRHRRWRGGRRPSRRRRCRRSHRRGCGSLTRDRRGGRRFRSRRRGCG